MDTTPPPPGTLVIGTAGHIDHGKSTLVKALTGTDPDRLQEEKERGITIDLGFAFATLPDGTGAMFVDVPGHERFVRNMLAGAGGIDAVLLVVAADESVMPQTREHLDILELLRVGSGIVALTKADLVDADMLTLAEMEVRELVAGTFLADAPVVAVDGVSGRGLPELVARLEELARRQPPRADDRMFRLPVDRAFALKGFGTVVTGTTLGGTLEVGATIELFPSHATSRVRSVEVAGVARAEARAGERTALNLPEIGATAVARGEVAAMPSSLTPTTTLYARIELLSTSPVELESYHRVRLHIGAAEVLARVHPLTGEPIEPGAAALARLSLESPVTAVWRDRFVIRRYSPVVTIGGGTVLHGADDPLRMRPRQVASWLAELEDVDLAGAVAVLARHAGVGGIVAAELTPRLGYPPVRLDAELSAGVDSGRLLVTEGGRHVDRAALEPRWARIESLVEDHHRAHPLSPGIGKELLRKTVLPNAPADVFRLCLASLAATGRIEVDADMVRRPGFEVRTSDADTEALGRLEALFLAAGVNPPAPAEAFATLGLAPERGEMLLGLLARRGAIRRIGGALHFHARVLDEVAERLAALLPERETISVSDFKDLVGTSRKYAIPLLEHMDARAVTERRGDARRILPQARAGR